jgi:uncharacterized membrane protein
VGYGDVSPVTFPGRVIGAFTMVVGISTFAVVTAKVAEFLVRSDIEGAAAPPQQSTAEQILKERLAAGEIQIAEFTQLSKVLDRHPDTDA